jgi:hypothetical protein
MFPKTLPTFGGHACLMIDVVLQGLSGKICFVQVNCAGAMRYGAGGKNPVP